MINNDNIPHIDLSTVKETSVQHKKRNRLILFFSVLFLLVALIIILIWWEAYRNFESTDDAYVGGNIVTVASRQNGAVKAYFADSTNFVEVGQLIALLDETDYIADYEKKKNNLTLAAQNVVDLYQDVQQKKANLQVEQGRFERASINVNNRIDLAQTEAISRESFQLADADQNIAKALVDLARHQLNAAEAALGSTELKDHPKIINAKADLILAYSLLKRCRILAPISGYIAKRNVQVGQPVQAGAALMNIIPLNNVWVDANFKETQLRRIRIGQPVKFTADIYGEKVIYEGIVEGIVPGSGSTFSLIPTQNATGNWIKIVQRVPVRIKIDPKTIIDYPLVLGLSVYTSIDVSDVSGLMLADKPIKQEVITPVLDIDLKPIETIASEIITNTLSKIHS